MRTAVPVARAGRLEAVVPLATPDRDPAIATVPRRCPRCDRRVGLLAQRQRTLRTTGGPLTCTRPWYHCARGRHGVSPVAATRLVPPVVRSSPAVAAWWVRRTVATPPRAAAALRTDWTGLVVHPDPLREHTTTVGAAPADADAAAIGRVQATRAAADPVDPAPGTLVGETDGALVRSVAGGQAVTIGGVGGPAEGHVLAPS